MAETFGWAVINGRGEILLPVERTRVGAIGSLVTSFDASLTRRIGSRLSQDQALAWRRYKWAYGMKCARMKVETAFEFAS